MRFFRRKDDIEKDPVEVAKVDSNDSSADNEAEHKIKSALTDRSTFHPDLHSDINKDAEAVLEKSDFEREDALSNWLSEDSPHPEVRAAILLSRSRPSVLGLLALCLSFCVSKIAEQLAVSVTLTGAAITSYSKCYPTVRISGLVIQLVTFPIGKAMARWLPERRWNTPLGSFTLNPGPFNCKEHTLITLMSNVTYQGAYATDIMAAQRFFYGQNWSIMFALLVVLSTQCIGFSFAGLMRNFLIYPASAIWPAALVSSALMGALHSLTPPPQGYVSRGRFFMIMFACAFFYYFLPGYLATFLSAFGYITWIRPQNIVLSQLFGVSTGLGMGFLTFDWSQIAYLGSPLMTPWWAEANVIAGLVVLAWVALPILYYSNWNNAAYLPILSTRSFDRFGKHYNTTAILTPLKTFDLQLYDAYSQQYLPVSLVLSYGASFAGVSSVLVHVWLYHGREIVRQFKMGIKEKPDVHARLMMAYQEVPHWWYAITGLACLVGGIIAITVWPTEMPVWAFFLAIIFGSLFILPIGVVLSLTNQELGLNVITEFIIGFAVPGRPVSLLLFKTWGYMTMYQGLNLVSDQKWAHYMKIPPRSTFRAQLIPTIIASFVVVLVQVWAFDNIDGICTPEASDNFVCQNTTVFSTASVVWGLIGPARNFAAGRRYSHILWFFLVGAFAPFITWLLTRRYPRSWVRYVSFPVMFSAIAYIPPATGINYSSWALVGFIFNYLIRRRNPLWWAERNYILSAALDAGTGISALIIFFCFTFPSGPQQNLHWWGNDWWQNTADSLGLPYLTTPAEGFAPAPGGTTNAA